MTTADLTPTAPAPIPPRLSRQARRYAERQQAKARDRTPAAPPGRVIVPARIAAIADAVPTHRADCLAHTPHKVRLASGRFVSNRDFAAWHEAGHAAVMLAGGLPLAYVRVVPADEPTAAACGLWVGRCQPYERAPGGMTRHDVYRSIAVGAVAGPLAATTVRTGLGLVEVGDPPQPHPAEVRNPGDDASLATALDVLGIAPRAVAAYEEQLRAEALALLYRHRQQFGALVAALLAHQVLNVSEIFTIWQRGAFDFRGRVGSLGHCISGPEDLADPAFRRILRERYDCVT